MQTQDKKTEAEIAAIRGEFVCEPPNTNLEKLNGTYYYTNPATSSPAKVSVSNEQVGENSSLLSRVRVIVFL